jgi:3-deoxy-D-manno-octulosonate 8-phosphate phosphatase (KDO 8-P phosphatase)
MQEKLQKIRVLLMDVDGVMTDGRIIYNNQGIETKVFDVKDGHGLKILQQAGIKTGIITGRTSDVVKYRAQELGIDFLYQGAKDKLAPYFEIIQTCGFAENEVSYIGDDFPDIPILRRVGFAVTVFDAVEEVKKHVHKITSCPGGRGAVREVCDLLLKGGGHWERIVSAYL